MRCNVNSFDEFENATVHPPEASKLPGQNVPKEKPGNNEVPQPSVIPPAPRPEMVSAVDEWIKLIVKWVAIFLLLAILLFAIWNILMPMIPTTAAMPEMIEKTIYEVPAETQKQVSQLQKDVTWLQALLAKAKKELKVERENHATTRERLKRALISSSADEKYKQFLQYAITKFYNTPLPKNVHMRSLCFTTDTSKEECLQMERPEGWFEGDTRPPIIRRL